MGSKKHSEESKMMSEKYLVACEIYHQNALGNEVWFNKIVDIFGDSMKVDIVSNSVDKLFDKGIVLSGESKHLDQYKGVVYFIAPEYVEMIGNCYELHWKDIRNKWLSKNKFVTESYSN